MQGLHGEGGLPRALGCMECPGHMECWGACGAGDCGCFGVPWVHPRGVARGACSAGGLCGPCDTWGVRGFGVREVSGELRLEPSGVLLPACPKTRGARGRQVLLLLD